MTEAVRNRPYQLILLDEIEKAHVEVLLALLPLLDEGRMTEHGLREVEAAKAEGRWDRAYRVKEAQIPDDLQAAIDADPAAKAMFAKLTSQNRFALAFRTQNLKTEAGRKKRIAAFVEMLATGIVRYC